MKRRLSAWYYAAATLLTWAVVSTFTRWEVVHGERVPAEGPVVLVSNHLHLIDPPLVAASCHRRVHPMAKRELFETPLVGWTFWLYGAFPVRRFSADIGALRAARNYLRNGEAVLMFPEGTRSLDARLHPALPGAAMVALLAKAPIVPVAISGTEEIRVPGVFFRWLRRDRLVIRVAFGEPFHAGAEAGADAADAGSVAPGSVAAGSAERATDATMRRIAELLPERYRGAYGAETEGEVVVARQSRPERTAPAARGGASPEDAPSED